MIVAEDEELTGDREIGPRGQEREEGSARMPAGRRVQVGDLERAGQAPRPTEEHEQGPGRRKRPSDPFDP